MSRGPFDALSDHEEGCNSRDGEGYSCSSAMRQLLREVDYKFLRARGFEVFDAIPAFGSIIPKPPTPQIGRDGQAAPQLVPSVGSGGIIIGA